MGNSIVIIIDQWNWELSSTSQRKKLDTDLPRRIINFIETNSIHTAALASSACSEELYSDTIWYRNRLPIANVLDDYSEFKSCNQSTVDLLLNYENSVIFQLAMREEKELEVYLKEHPRITNIYITGAAWEKCIRKRPLGYENVYNKFCKGTKRRLLVSLDCVETLNCTPPLLDTNIQWKKIQDQIYQYCPD